MDNQVSRTEPRRGELDLEALVAFLKVDLSERQLDVFVILANESGPITNVEIAEELQVTPAAIHQLRARIRKQAESLVALGFGVLR